MIVNLLWSLSNKEFPSVLISKVANDWFVSYNQSKIQAHLQLLSTDSRQVKIQCWGMYTGVWLEGLEEPEMTGYWRL